MPSPFAVPIELTAGEREQLQSWSRRHTSAQALALRSRIVLAAADGLTNTEVAARLQIKRSTAAKWRTRFAEARLDGLTDEPRPGQPRTITDAFVGHVARFADNLGLPGYRTLVVAHPVSSKDDEHLRRLAAAIAPAAEAQLAGPF